MLVTELGMVTEVRFEHPEKRELPTAVILEPIVTSARLVQELSSVPEKLRPRYNFLMELGRL